jgi:hypothetical protein
MCGTNKNFAEIIESSLEQCTAQTWYWDTIPLFGSLMAIQDPEHLLFGIVHHIQTGSTDTSRVPFTYQKTMEELLRDQPQIFAFFKTTFSCLIVGYLHKGSIIYTLAPQPARIHTFVKQADEALAHQFFAAVDYLYCLFGVHNKDISNDELLLALLARNYPDAPYTLLRHVIHTYASLVGNDYRRIRLFAQRMRGITTRMT